MGTNATNDRASEPRQDTVTGTKSFIDGIAREREAYVTAIRLFNALTKLGKDDAAKSRSGR